MWTAAIEICLQILPAARQTPGRQGKVRVGGGGGEADKSVQRCCFFWPHDMFWERHGGICCSPCQMKGNPQHIDFQCVAREPGLLPHHRATVFQRPHTGCKLSFHSRHISSNFLLNWPQFWDTVRGGELPSLADGSASQVPGIVLTRHRPFALRSSQHHPSRSTPKLYAIFCLRIDYGMLSHPWFALANDTTYLDNMKLLRYRGCFRNVHSERIILHVKLCM